VQGDAVRLGRHDERVAAKLVCYHTTRPSIALLLDPALHFIITQHSHFNPITCRGNYSATPNNMKLVHWPLMGGLLH